jgi:hypothetical protein
MRFRLRTRRHSPRSGPLSRVSEGDLNPETRDISPIRGDIHGPSLAASARGRQARASQAARGRSAPGAPAGLRPHLAARAGRLPGRPTPAAAGCGVLGADAAPLVTLCAACGGRTGEISHQLVAAGMRGGRHEQRGTAIVLAATVSCTVGGWTSCLDGVRRLSRVLGCFSSSFAA